MMDTKIKAIETKYKGYRFRSRLEARWAVFLDSFNEEWQYEIEGYELSSGRYLPDFWLPRLYCWLEIKGVTPTSKEESLCYELANATGKPIAMAWDLPVVAQRYYHDGKNRIPDWVAEITLGCPQRAEFVRQGKANPVHEAYMAERLKVYCHDSTDSSGGDQWWEECFWAIDKNGKLCICSNNSWRSRTFTSPSSDPFPGMMQRWEIQKPIDKMHVDKAKSARFEFQR